MDRKKLAVVGAVLLVIGSIGLVFSLAQMGGVAEAFQDPENDALKTLNFDGEGSKTVELEEGEYEIWTEEGEEIDTLDVTDEEGDSVFERDEGETITIDRPGSEERAYDKIGTLHIEERGEYTFETDERCTLYVTDHHPFFDLFGSMLLSILMLFGSIGLAIAGGGLLIWGWVLKKDCPYCGKTISKDSARCEHCNRDLTNGIGTYTNKNGYRRGYQEERVPPPPDEERSGQRRQRRDE